MSIKKSRFQRRQLSIFSGLLFVAAVATRAETVVLPNPAVGEVTARDVYVRCGPSQNHYPVCKLQPGDRVTIVAEQGDWLSIQPPKGVFSLISGEFVDTVDNQSGVINGENVRVRAGSSLTEDRYQVQAQLRKGSTVRILGKNDDGFVRIEPPAGSAVWINKQFIERISEARLKLEAEGIDPKTAAASGDTVKSPESATATGASEPSTEPPATAGKRESSLASHSETAVKPLKATIKVEAVADAVPIGDQSEVPSPLSTLPPTDQRKSLEELDRAAATEMSKSPVDRNLEGLIGGYRRIADQNDDEVAKRYAEARITQLTQVNELVSTMKQMRDLTESTDAQRRKMMEERADAPYTVLPTVLSGYDAQGELRTSALYPPGSQPRRFRLVDPTKAGGQTVGYIEVAPDSTVQVEAYLGRFVGVKAIEKRIQSGGVNPIPLYVVREVAPLEPAVPAERGQSQS